MCISRSFAVFKRIFVNMLVLMCDVFCCDRSHSSQLTYRSTLKTVNKRCSPRVDFPQKKTSSKHSSRFSGANHLDHFKMAAWSRKEPNLAGLPAEPVIRRSSLIRMKQPPKFLMVSQKWHISAFYIRPQCICGSPACGTVHEWCVTPADEQIGSSPTLVYRRIASLLSNKNRGSSQVKGREILSTNEMRLNLSW